MTGKFFISYRRKDASGSAGRLRDILESKFGREHLFFDVDSIDLGDDFLDVMKQQVTDCIAFIPVIGPQWINIRDAKGERRLDDPKDPVRVEIETALGEKKPILPVLVDDASMPTAEQLPDTIASFARRNSVTLTHGRFRSDCDDLISKLNKIVAPNKRNRFSVRKIASIIVAVAAIVGSVASLANSIPSFGRLLTEIFATQKKQPSAAEIAARLSPSVGSVFVKGTYVTCIVISEQGYALAPAFLFDGIKPANANLGSTELRRVTFVKSESGVALVKIEGSDFSTATISTAPIDVGDPLFVFTRNDANAPVLRSDTMINSSDNTPAITTIIRPKEIGSPVLNAYGAVVGMAITRDGSVTNLVPMRTLKGLLATANVRGSP